MSQQVDGGHERVLKGGGGGGVGGDGGGGCGGTRLQIHRPSRPTW